MSAKRRKAATIPLAAPGPAGEITAAFERQKHRFLSRYAAQCPYLLIQLQPDLQAGRLTLIASFSFTSDRAWQQVETQLAIDKLRSEAGPEPHFIEAFARLGDGIGAARIARLFSPLSEAQRNAAGR